MDLTILTFGNGLRMSLRVAGRLAEYGIAASGSWICGSLAPLPIDDIVRESAATGRVLVADETRHARRRRRRRRHRSGRGRLPRPDRPGIQQDSFIPLGDAATTVLLDEPAIDRAVRNLIMSRPVPDDRRLG